MRKTLSKIFIAVVMTVLLVSLFGCNKYTSSYKAIGFVHTNTAKNASMSFVSFEGTMVFKLKCEGENEKIQYSAKLDDGSAKVFYDCDGTKTELFCVNSDGEIVDIGGALTKGTVYIIVETDGVLKDGRFEFKLK